MNPAIEKLTKFLHLEADRGYDNRAVLGGLERILDAWQGEARQHGASEALIGEVASTLAEYPGLTPDGRRQAAERLLRSMEQGLPAQPAAPTTGPAPSEQEQPTTEAPGEVGPEDAFEPGVDRAGAGRGPECADSAPITAAATPAERASEQPVSPGTGAPTQPKPTPPTGPRRAPSAPAPAALEAPLTSISGIGPKSASTLSRLGLETLGDLLWYLPRRYDDYTQLKTINRLWFGEDVTIIGTVEDISVRPVRGGSLKLVDAVIGDGSASLRVTWFNQPWIAQQLQPGRAVVLSGRVDQYLGRLTMNNPEWEPLERQQLHTNRIVPVYGLTAGITPKWLRRLINTVVTRYASRVPDPIPTSVRESAGLMPLGPALQQAHFPDSWEQLRSAQSRLAFDEMFLLLLGVMRQKREWVGLKAEPLTVPDTWFGQFVARLPYALTPPQQKAVEEIRADLAAPRPMNRLLQGDVGSGKTVVASAAIAITAMAGRQSAVMAPTSILAEQHHRTLTELLTRAADIPAASIRLLIGGTPEAEKRAVREGLASGAIRVVIGTHALLEEPITFSRLGLAVIDEQHRFGVEQRSRLRAKGDNPNLLVMTATPIPRSLALTVYGDLDLTVIDVMPPGRQPIETRLLRPVERGRAHSFIISQLEAGRQAFIVYPLVEGSEKVEAMAAVDEHARLQEEVFHSHRVGLLHGRLRADEKDAVMAAFRARETQVLVSTSVVELGVDVPNATVMLIEGANHFGLAQLHQFRGRVGRGQYQSYCLLMPDSDDEAGNQRLRAMESTNDGFRLAEMDLEQRGPGDFLGARQSGFAELRMAQLTDVRLIDKARREAARLFDADPDLAAPEHVLLRGAAERFWAGGKGEIS
jgi:ATP-dependent DNA helicase RecG